MLQAQLMQILIALLLYPPESANMTECDGHGPLMSVQVDGKSCTSLKGQASGAHQDVMVGEMLQHLS